MIRTGDPFTSCVSTLHRFPSTPNISDHVPVIFHLLLPEPIPKGSPFWRLNTKRLTTNTAAALSAALRSHIPIDGPVLPQWENTKRFVRSFFSRPSKRATDHGERFSGEHPSSVSVDPLRDAFEKRLLLGRIKADQARELPSPLLSSLIDHNISSNHIPAIKTPSGDLCTLQAEIANTSRQWFESQFSPKPSSTTPLHRRGPKFSQDTINALRVPITGLDIMEAASRTKKHSAPGVDGIPYIVYSKVPYLAELLSRVIEESLQVGSFPPPWSETVIRPILKPGKDPLQPKSYRPIALICCDYKLFSLILSHRIRPDLPQMFPAHQTGFIPGRSTHMAAMRLLSLLHSTPESVPLLLDCEKAYDRVSHEWLEHCMIQTGFPQHLSRLLINIYTTCSGRVITNNRLSRSFQIRSGIRQGDPIAPLLYILSMEPLLIELETRGLAVQAHCDDTAVVYTPTLGPSLSEALRTGLRG